MIHKQHLKKLIKKTKSDTVFLAITYAILILLSLLVIIPIMNVLAFSVSPEEQNAFVTFLPQGFTLKYFEYVIFHDDKFVTSFLNSVFLTLTITITSNVLMALAAYPLSKDDLPFKKPIMVFFIITMLFGAGILPTCLMLKWLGLLGSLWGIIVLSINNVFNMLLFKSFFEGLPKETIEAAEVDGVSTIQLFFRIVLPMSLPVFASCCFFTIVGTWNSYSGALIFIGIDSEYANQWPLALYIYSLISTKSVSNTSSFLTIQNLTNIQSASIVVSTIPILFIYPFVIRYIKSGITLGSEK